MVAGLDDLPSNIRDATVARVRLSFRNHNPAANRN
jgi:hypothetical protein